MIGRAALAGVLGLLATLFAVAPADAATAWKTVVALSTLEFTGTLSGGEFKGRFRQFDADVAFDPADLPGSRFLVRIQTASADTAEPDRDKALTGADFFAADRWPTATYEASQFTAKGPGQFEARGKLTLRGVAREIPVTFSFKPAADGQSAALTGATTVRRLDFGVGQGQWQDTQWIGNDVRIRFELILHREK